MVGLRCRCFLAVEISAAWVGVDGFGVVVEYGELVDKEVRQ